MLRGGEAVLVAVSGGPDSVALLDVLYALRESLGLTLTAVHVHHGLRPEADAEADGSVASANTWTCRACRAGHGTPGAALGWARGGEPSRPPRRARARGARGRGRAHRHRSHRRRPGRDRADELLQGAGPAGWAASRRRGALIAPLIETRRSAIEEYLRRARARLGEDPSNRDPRFPSHPHPPRPAAFMAELTGASVVEALGRSAAAARAVGPTWKSGAGRPRALATRDGRDQLDVGALAERAARAGAEMLRQARPPRRDAPLRGPPSARSAAARGARAAARPGGRLAVEAAAAGCAWGRWRCPRS